MDSSDSWSQTLVGKTLADRYRVTSVLGAGGVGAVFGATHLAVGRRVALKVLRPELLSHPSVVERFHREARAAAACARKGVVDVIDLGEDPACGPFLVMEHLEGETLSARLRARAPLPPGEALTVVHEILDTLAAVHARGIVHRDLKPGNVMLAKTPEGREVVKILDFGLARELVGTTGPALTMPGSILGTPRYMAPEQAAGDPTVDARADLYAVGAILYSCLAGRPPYADVAPDEAMHAVLLRAPIPLEELRPDLPGKLTAVVARAMARNREDRYADAASLRAALQDALPGFDASTTVSQEAQPIPSPVRLPSHSVDPQSRLPSHSVDPQSRLPSHSVDPQSRLPSHSADAPSRSTRTVDVRPPSAAPIAKTPDHAPPPPRPSSSLGRIVTVSCIVVVALGAAAALGAIGLGVGAWQSIRSSPRFSPGPLLAPPPAPTAVAPPPVVVPPMPPIAQTPIAPPPFMTIESREGLVQNPATGEIHCTSGEHSLSLVRIELRLRIVLFVESTCSLTCRLCVFGGEGPVILVSGRGRLRYESSTSTSSAGSAIFVGDEASATLQDARVFGREPADIQGSLTTRNTMFRAGVARGPDATIVDQGGNIGL